MSNPSIQCSMCGRWMRLHGKDKDGCAIQRFYPCCGEHGENEHEKDVCNECCETKCPYKKHNDMTDLEALRKEITAAIIIGLPNDDYKRGFNNALKRALVLLNQYEKGEGLFQNTKQNKQP